MEINTNLGCKVASRGEHIFVHHSHWRQSYKVCKVRVFQREREIYEFLNYQQ
jgi:hypothetical protein